jgi:hypothetical protein
MATKWRIVGGNATKMSAKGAGELDFEHKGTYAQLNAFDWTNA